MASSRPRDGKCSDSCICWVASRFFSLWAIREAPKSYVLPSYSEEIERSESRSVMSDSLQPHTIVHGILQARILEWVAFPFFRGSSQPTGWTQFSHIAGRFFTSWANGREAQWQTFFPFLILCCHSDIWFHLNLVKVKVAQLCPTLCSPMDYAVHEILQARILERVPFPFSRVSSQPRDWAQVSLIVGGFFTSWAIREAQEYCSG